MMSSVECLARLLIGHCPPKSPLLQLSSGGGRLVALICVKRTMLLSCNCCQMRDLHKHDTADKSARFLFMRLTRGKLLYEAGSKEIARDSIKRKAAFWMQIASEWPLYTTRTHTGAKWKHFSRTIPCGCEFCLLASGLEPRRSPDPSTSSRRSQYKQTDSLEAPIKL